MSMIPTLAIIKQKSTKVWAKSLEENCYAAIAVFFLKLYAHVSFFQYILVPVDILKAYHNWDLWEFFAWMAFQRTRIGTNMTMIVYHITDRDQ